MATSADQRRYLLYWALNSSLAETLMAGLTSWTLLLAGAYAGNDVRKMILAEYQRILGKEIEELHFFDVAACVKRIASVMMSLFAGADQMGMRPDAVENMRRDFPALQKMSGWVNLEIRQPKQPPL